MVKSNARRMEGYLQALPPDRREALAALASQNNYMSVYLMNVYGNKKTEAWLHGRYRASGKKLDMGKPCVHLRKPEDLPLDLIGETIRCCTVEQYIRRCEQSRRGS